LANLGYKSLDELIGHSEILDTKKAISHWKASGLDLSPILHRVKIDESTSMIKTIEQDHGLDKALDNKLIEICKPALEKGELVRAQLEVRNVNRTVGTMLGSEVTRKYGGSGLPEGTIELTFNGSAGQSFGAFIPKGMTLRLEGDTNDYLGKGLSGGKIVVRPDRQAKFDSATNVIAGNVIAYGATSGTIFVRGLVGERFCVRNSGATAVVEGVGDHGCEYMTGGKVVVLGKTGRNFAAGMSGGIAYVLNINVENVNAEMVELEELDASDKEFLTQILKDFVEETDSTIAKQLIQNKDLSGFTKVMPREYKRVLLAQAQAKLDGTDPMQAVMEVSRG
jgi:glutamate synthase (NADPH/NADH) large chain